MADPLTTILPPYLTPELGDLLPQLATWSVPVRIGYPVLWMDPCGACADDVDRAHDQPPTDGVATVCHRVPSDVREDGFVYLEPACAEHLLAAVRWELHRGCPVWVRVPLSIGVPA